MWPFGNKDDKKKKKQAQTAQTARKKLTPDQTDKKKFGSGYLGDTTDKMSKRKKALQDIMSQ